MWGRGDPRSWPIWPLELSLLSSPLTRAVLLLTILSLLLALWPSRVFSGDPGFTAGAVLLLLLIAGITAIIWRQPQNPSPLPFRVGDLMCPAVQAEGLKSACFEVKPPLLDQGRGDLLKPMDLPWSHPVRPPHPQSQWSLSAQPEEDLGLPAHVGEGPPSLTWVLCSGSHWLCPQVPALPVLPVLSIFVNVYLMMQMSSVTWAQCGIWNALGEWLSGMKKPLE